MNNLYTVKIKPGPLISLALHDGHFIEENILKHMALDEHERFREEDPYTAFIAKLPISHILVNSSRFMLDLNRVKNKAIYKNEEDAWGLKVWKDTFPEKLEQHLLSYYDQFYEEIDRLIKEKINSYGCFLILDIHSYNHRRQSPKHQASVIENPEINLGTFYNHPKWESICKKFLGYLSNSKIKGKFPDVRENIVFKGGGFSQWLNKNYGEKGCVISIEFKKIFMDEWTGRADIKHIKHLKSALKGTLPLLSYELTQMHQI